MAGIRYFLSLSFPSAAFLVWVVCANLLHQMLTLIQLLDCGPKSHDCEE